MDLKNISEADLKAELKRREDEKLAEEKQKRDETAATCLRHIDALLELVPDHSRTTCSDSNHCNGEYTHSSGNCRCLRCYLLECKLHEQWSPLMRLNFTMERLDPI